MTIRSHLFPTAARPSEEEAPEVKPPAPPEDGLNEQQRLEAMRKRLDRKWEADAQREYLKLVFGA